MRSLNVTRLRPTGKPRLYGDDACRFRPGVSFPPCTRGQYPNCVRRHILESYRARVNTIPTGNKPAAWKIAAKPGPIDETPPALAGFQSRWSCRVFAGLLYSRNNPDLRINHTQRVLSYSLFSAIIPDWVERRPVSTIAIVLDAACFTFMCTTTESHHLYLVLLNPGGK